MMRAPSSNGREPSQSDVQISESVRGSARCYASNKRIGMKGRFRRTTGPDGTLATHRDKTIQTGHVQFGYGFRNGDGIHVLDGNICDLDETGAFSRRTT